MRRISAFQITDASSFPFSANQYSLFKFGSKSTAKLFGKMLFIRFKRNLFDEYGLNLGGMPQLVICSAPYNHIPTATGAMKDYFVKFLNEWLVAVDKPVVQETKVHRNTSYREDYGSLTKEQRLALIGGDSFHIDTSFIKGKLVVFIDDIRITGSHEEMMNRMLVQCAIPMNAYKHMFLYFAELTNPDIHPNIENELNFASINGIEDILAIIKEDDFVFNTRVVKYLLNSNPIEFEIVFTFIQREGGGIFLDTIYHLAIGNSYHLVPEYQENLTLIKDLLDGDLK